MRLFNAYYKNHVCDTAFPPIILDSTLSAITWIKAGEVENLPENELLKNAYSAMQPNPEIMLKVEEILQKLKGSGKIGTEEIAALRVSRVFRDDIWKESFGETESVTEISVQDAKRRYEQQLIESEVSRHKNELGKIEEKHRHEVIELNSKMNAMSAEHDQKLFEMETRLRDQEEEKQRQQRERNEKIRVFADQYAKQKRKKWLSQRVIMAKIVLGIISLISIGGVILGINKHSNILVTIILFVTAFIAIVSNVQTVYSQRSWIIGFIEKQANKYETKIREQKLQEYKNFSENESTEITC